MVQTDLILDAKGLACPMPIVKTKKMMKTMDSGKVLEILATDKGSTADLQAWAKSSGHQYIGTETEGDVLRHFLRKDGAGAPEETITIPEISLADFSQKVEANESMTVLDVREKDEFEDAHIPGAIHIPLGEVEARMDELAKEDAIYIICHSGRRSGIAGDMMAKKGFGCLYNVVPGMSDWTGITE
ncbi:TusA-related sulfurtransferase/rhodanese-related sulfurtransferase [Planomicrobium stackebrandtii]|uniref:TusA-related sulfurtransferase/rhodanese-related sulfurtransferase n=1 Tax=Planomicrobium stackebrandtii TaxID=253160 RepID=A0ABU0GRM4_9BACL|nr:sulfurtransferase TusA family protein [Planomicrobium stackebrandtii]MDQ0428010.1 TusA-related sulfurtransferase/rhodanese-related sulfurtransferase [Planomicrobium stackebrandtii]